MTKINKLIKLIETLLITLFATYCALSLTITNFFNIIIFALITSSLIAFALLAKELKKEYP